MVVVLYLGDSLYVPTVWMIELLTSVFITGVLWRKLPTALFSGWTKNKGNKEHASRKIGGKESYIVRVIIVIEIK